MEERSAKKRGEKARRTRGELGPRWRLAQPVVTKHRWREGSTGWSANPRALQGKMCLRSPTLIRVQWMRSDGVAQTNRIHSASRGLDPGERTRSLATHAVADARERRGTARHGPRHGSGARGDGRNVRMRSVMPVYASRAASRQRGQGRRKQRDAFVQESDNRAPTSARGGCYTEHSAADRKLSHYA